MSSKELPQTVRLTAKASAALNNLKRMTGASKQAIVERSVIRFAKGKRGAA